MRETDLIVIGGGPAGYAGAIRAAQKGLKVILVEARDLGGTCLNRGCIPTKALFKAQQVSHLVQAAEEFGIQAKFEGINWEKVQSRKSRVVRQLTGGVRLLLQKAGVEVVPGFASFLDARTIQVEREGKVTEEIKGKFILLASGSESASLPVPGADLEKVIDSETALELPQIPEKMVVIGGGVIGIEMASIYRGLGSKVTVIEMMPKILPPVDQEVTDLLTELLAKKEMTIHCQAQVKKIEEQNRVLKVAFEQKGEEKVAEGDYVLVATGRVPRVQGLQLEQAGVELEGKLVKVDSSLQTSIPWIYAPGDVNGQYLLAHVAYKEAEVAVSNIKGEERKIDYRVVPNCIFSSPEIASVGLTEAEAKDKGYSVTVGRFPFRASGKALIEGETEGLVKVVACRKTEEILGVHIIGPHASDLIAEAGLAMALECTPEEIASTIHAHPTLAESLMEAAEGVFGQSLHIF